MRKTEKTNKQKARCMSGKLRQRFAIAVPRIFQKKKKLSGRRHTKTLHAYRHTHKPINTAKKRDKTKTDVLSRSSAKHLCMPEIHKHKVYPNPVNFLPLPSVSASLALSISDCLFSSHTINSNRARRELSTPSV